MNKKTKQFLLDKEVKAWIRKNAGMVKDMEEINTKLLMFEVKWGFRPILNFEKPKEREGRWGFDVDNSIVDK